MYNTALCQMLEVWYRVITANFYPLVHGPRLGLIFTESPEQGRLFVLKPYHDSSGLEYCLLKLVLQSQQNLVTM